MPNSSFEKMNNWPGRSGKKSGEILCLSGMFELPRNTFAKIGKLQ